MLRLTRFRLLAFSALFVPIVNPAQAPKPHIPPATVRELATIEGKVSSFVKLPSGRVLIYSANDSTFSYDVATKQRTLLGTDMYPLTVSPQGDRLAFSRSAEDHTGPFMWTMPIDPKTGIGTAPAHRVGLRPEGGSRHASFSPDGKVLAYRAGLRTDTSWDITLVPAAGGAERVVARFPDREAFAWAVDGKSLYVERAVGHTAIERVPISGGLSEAMFPRTPLTVHWVVGLAPDASVALFQNNPDRFFYRTAAGAEGEIPVALPPLDDGWGHDFSLASTRYTTMTVDHHSSVRILDIATGKSRDLLPGNLATSAPSWSPDGRKVAVLVGSLSQLEIAIMNADGSGLRRYPLPKDLNGWGEPWGFPWGMPWSPDGHYLAFRARDRGEVGKNDTERLVVLLDVNSGQTRVLTTASAAIISFVWRSDGKAIRALKASEGPGGVSLWSIVELPVNGPERVVRDISGEYPQPRAIVFMSDREVAFAVLRGKELVRYALPLDGGVVRRLPDPGSDPTPRGGILVAGNRLLIGQMDARGEARVIKILSTEGDSVRTLRLPFNNHHGASLPDGQHIINVGKAAGDSAWKLFLVPLDGSATRVLGEIHAGTGGDLAISPDGKLVAYTAEGRYTSKFYEIDFAPPLQALVRP